MTHALLLAINNYHPSTSVPPLAGCLNDLSHLQNFLQNKIASSNLNIQTLTNEQATYANVITAFEQHLMKAQKDDTVLFAFSGHGSREEAMPIFEKYYPEGKQETLVLYDSRLPDGKDLADKELAFLLEAVAAKGAHIVVILDCCHSGSGTRDLDDFDRGTPRQVEDKTTVRPTRHFLQGFQKDNYGDNYLESRFPNGMEIYLPNPRHILLAACSRWQQACEINQRGVFSESLLSVLEAQDSPISYAELFKQCRRRVAQRTKRQHPKFQAQGYFNGYDAFLQLGQANKRNTVKLTFENKNWQIAMGAANGLATLTDKSAYFEVFQGAKKVGKARTSFVGLDKSTVVLDDFNGNMESEYDVRLVSLLPPPALFALDGLPQNILATQEALALFRPLYFSLETGLPLAEYLLQIKYNEIQIIRTADQLVLSTLRGDNWSAMYQDAFEKLEQIAYWTQAITLENQQTKIKDKDLEVVLQLLDSRGNEVKTLTESEVEIPISKLAGQEQKVRFQVSIRNNHATKRRYCTLFYASPSYGFYAVGFNEWVRPNSKAIAWDRLPNGEPLFLALNGKETATDIFQVLVSNEEIDVSNLNQVGFAIGKVVFFGRHKSSEISEDICESTLRGGMPPRYNEDNNVDWRTVSMIVKSFPRDS